MTKGSRRELEAADILKSEGWAVYRPATVQFGENDVFGLFDILAINPDMAGGPLAIQVKSNGNRGIMRWQAQTWLFRRCGFLTDYWAIHDREGWRVTVVTDRKRNIRVDERDRDVPIGEGVREYLRNHLRGSD